MFVNFILFINYEMVIYLFRRIENETERHKEFNIYAKITN